jgi:probable selenium-dependent hydroxylase accessory protein YqeC
MVNKMRLSKILGIKKHSLVSIVGSGGKTTFMYTLGKELRRDNRVLLSTTTKIFCPKSEEADFLVIGKEKFKNIINQKSKGIYVYGGSKMLLRALIILSLKQMALNASP